MNPKNKWLVGLVSVGMIAAATQLEGTRHMAYQDVANVWTVCQGYAGKDVVRGKYYSDDECRKLLITQLSEHGKAVLSCTNVPLNENEYAAYTLFAYNVGGSAYCRSSLLKKLNAGDRVGACNGLLAWDMADGKHVPGLLNRRKIEREICLRPAKEAV